MTTKRFTIIEDERFPVYSIAQSCIPGEPGGEEVEIDEAAVERWQRVLKEWGQVQQEMRNAFRSAWDASLGNKLSRRELLEREER